jgi:hypothetical protein
MSWWISWDKTKHTLKWAYGDIEDFAGYPVKFEEMQQYARRNFCLVFPHIRYLEWAYLMKFRAEALEGNEFFDEITLDVFPRKYFRNEPRLEYILPMIFVMAILQSATKWISNKNKQEDKNERN